MTNPRTTGPATRMQLDVAALDHNIRAMAEWCRDQNVELAPHIKTTMCEQIVQRQIAAGASAVTVATIDQARAALEWGCTQILIANEVLDEGELQTISDWLAADSDLRIIIFMDSDHGVAAANAVFSELNPLPCLIDIGTVGGRSGVREAADALKLAQLVVSSPNLRLAGVGGYEGVTGNIRSEENVGRIADHCALVATVFTSLRDEFEIDRPIFTMGGSAFPDVVVRHLPANGYVPGARFVLRSGCYVTHDHGTYAQVSPLEFLRAAVTVRATVLSVPEPGFAVLSAGRRDLPYDAGMPKLLRADGSMVDIEKLFDQHSVVRGSNGLQPGDAVLLGISHPCSLFDRWDHFDALLPDGSARTWSTTFTRAH